MRRRLLIAALVLGLAPIRAEACDYYSVEVGEGFDLSYTPTASRYAFSPENPLYWERFSLEMRGPQPHPFQRKVHI